MDKADAADSAVRQAEAERLTMQRSANATGYRGVRKDSLPQQVKVLLLLLLILVLDKDVLELAPHLLALHRFPRLFE